MPESPSEQDILHAPFSLTNAKWTSHEVAGVLGISQSQVARLWRKTYPAIEILPSMPANLEIIGAFLSRENKTLIFRQHEYQTFLPTALAKAMRSPRRPGFQLLLTAADLAQSAQEELPTEIGNLIAQSANAFVVDLETLTKTGNSNWSQLLTQLISCTAATSLETLNELSLAIRKWSKAPEQSFVWRATQDLPPKPISPGQSIRSTNQAVADQAIELLIENIRKGKLVAGSRVTESALARMLHTTRNQTRDALRALASAGLLDFHSSRGILVPSPTRSDVLEIYVARRALGSEIVRRCCQTTPHQIEEIAKTISQLKEIAKTKDAYLTGEADLAFQNALANASGLRTIPQMFTLLTNQLRIYIAILGFRYAYSVDEMVDDDSELFEVIATRNQAAAVTKWQKKMSAAYEYMASEVR